MGTSAKVLAPGEVRRLERRANRGRHAARNSVIVQLSFKAGLRACEIAGLDWAMVLTPRGNVGPAVLIGDAIAKNGRGRRVPVHSDLRKALIVLHRMERRPVSGAVVRSQKGGHMTARSIVNWFASLYSGAGLEGCSSHSGRRTFITRTARLVSKAGASLRDIQILVGHRDLATTQLYIDGDTDAQRKLVALL